MIRVTGVDLSLTGTGLTRVTIGGDGPLASARLIESRTTDDSVAARSLRLRTIAHEVYTRCVGSDLVVIEGPSFGSKGGAAHDRSGLWWLVCARLTGNRIPVVEVPPTSLKVYALGTGRGDKDQVLAAVIKRYGHLVDIVNNNTADALLLADMGARHLNVPLLPLPQTHTRALTAVHWPTITRQETTA